MMHHELREVDWWIRCERPSTSGRDSAASSPPSCDGEDVRKFAGHDQQRTTIRYSRDTENAIKRTLEIVGEDDE